MPSSPNIVLKTGAKPFVPRNASDSSTSAVDFRRKTHRAKPRLGRSKELDPVGQETLDGKSLPCRKAKVGAWDCITGK